MQFTLKLFRIFNFFSKKFSFALLVFIIFTVFLSISVKILQFLRIRYTHIRIHVYGCGKSDKFVYGVFMYGYIAHAVYVLRYAAAIMEQLLWKYGDHNRVWNNKQFFLHGKVIVNLWVKLYLTQFYIVSAKFLSSLVKFRAEICQVQIKRSSIC